MPWAHDYARTTGGAGINGAHLEECIEAAAEYLAEVGMDVDAARSCLGAIRPEDPLPTASPWWSAVLPMALMPLWRERLAYLRGELDGEAALIHLAQCQEDPWRR